MAESETTQSEKWKNIAMTFARHISRFGTMEGVDGYVFPIDRKSIELARRVTKKGYRP